MTPIGLQNALIAEVEDLLKNFECDTVSGEKVSGVKGYKQMLPIVTQNDDEYSKFFPYFIVRIKGGETESDDEPWMVTASVFVGIIDENEAADGHLQTLQMITRITNRFIERPVLNSTYRASQEIKWAIEEESTYPYYFGEVLFKFYTPKIGRSDDFA